MRVLFKQVYNFISPLCLLFRTAAAAERLSAGHHSVIRGRSPSLIGIFKIARLERASPALSPNANPGAISVDHSSRIHRDPYSFFVSVSAILPVARCSHISRLLSKANAISPLESSDSGVRLERLNRSLVRIGPMLYNASE